MAEAPRIYEQTTRGVTVRVAAFYLEDQSLPEQGRFAWAYRVNIRNGTSDTVKLMARSWRIIDARGRVQHVHGEGVVGEQPVLPPGAAFEYTSGTPLDTPTGFMDGAYHMVTCPSAGEGREFDVVIPAFSLDSPHQDNRVH
jgi:ApaG protein